MTGTYATRIAFLYGSMAPERLAVMQAACDRYGRTPAETSRPVKRLPVQMDEPR